MKRIIGNDWDDLLADEWEKPYYTQLREFLKNEYSNEEIYPKQGDIYNALKLTPFEDVKVVILGQDPYHEPGQAQGLAFSVPYDVPAPPSLQNILRELRDDVGVQFAGADDGGMRNSRDDSKVSGILVPWAEQGVLLLNTVMTVRAHHAGSHRARGWEQFTDRVIELLAARTKPMVFVLWGANAGAKSDLIIRTQTDTAPDPENPLRHLIIRAPHPSPLSAYRGFFGGRYFSRCNYFLEDNGTEPVDWSLEPRPVSQL